MTNPDYRKLCAELLAWAEHTSSHYYKQPDVLDRARALLAQQPVSPPCKLPEPEGLTDEEIEEWADACSEAPLEEMDPEVHGWRRCFTAKEFSETIRAALARWGNSQEILDSSPQPAPLSPATQAVYNAVLEICPAPADEIAAATLRAVADQVVPQCRKPMYADSWEESAWTAQQDARADLLAIAAELEGANA